MNEQEPNPEAIPGDSMEAAIQRHNLTDAERLLFLLAISPYYFGSPHAMLGTHQEINYEAYAQEIIAKRDTTTASD